GGSSTLRFPRMQLAERIAPFVDNGRPSDRPVQEARNNTADHTSPSNICVISSDDLDYYAARVLRSTSGVSSIAGCASILLDSCRDRFSKMGPPCRFRGTSAF